MAAKLKVNTEFINGGRAETPCFEYTRMKLKRPLFSITRASSSASSSDSIVILTEDDISGVSLEGRIPSLLKNKELRFLADMWTRFPRWFH